MHKFKSFAYLDVQKTASTFIATYLLNFSNEPPTKQKNHSRVKPKNVKGKFFIISCRDPLDQYISLYSFGCDGRGGLHGRLEKAGMAESYDRSADGFDRWIRMLLDPDSAVFLGEQYAASQAAPLVGFQTYRFLVMAIPDAVSLLPTCHARADVETLYSSKNVARWCVRYENLIESLKELTKGPLADRITDVRAALRYLDESPPINASNRLDSAQPFHISDEILRLIEDREWFFFEKLGYRRYTDQATSRDKASPDPVR